MDTFLTKHYPFKGFVSGLLYIYQFLKNQLQVNLEEKENELVWKEFPDTHLDNIICIKKSDKSPYNILGYAPEGCLCGEQGYTIPPLSTIDYIQDGITRYNFRTTNYNIQNSLQIDFPSNTDILWGFNCQSDYPKSIYTNPLLIDILLYSATYKRLYWYFNMLAGLPYSLEDDIATVVLTTRIETQKGHIYTGLTNIAVQTGEILTKYQPLTSNVVVSEVPSSVKYDSDFWGDYSFFDSDSNWNDMFFYDSTKYNIDIYHAVKQWDNPPLDIYFKVPDITIWVDTIPMSASASCTCGIISFLQCSDSVHISPTTELPIWVDLTWEMWGTWLEIDIKIFYSKE